MIFNQILGNQPVDFKKKCQLRIWLAAGFVLLGLLSLLIVFLTHGEIPVLYLEEGHQSFARGFFSGMGGGLIAAGLITIYKNYSYLKHADSRKKREIFETDERNRLLGLRSWAYAGYGMFLLLYLGMIACAFVSLTIMKTLLVVSAVFALLLLFFRVLLQKHM